MGLSSSGSTIISRFVHRSYVRATIFLLYAGLSPLFAAVQQTPQRDPSAIAFLGQALSAAGGSANIVLIQDFTALGTITHSWGEAAEQGQLALKSRGLRQFRLDSQLPEGTWSQIVNNGVGETAFPSGTVVPLAYHNFVNSGSLTWPFLKLNAALLDQTTTIVDLGLVPLGSGQARQIRIQQNITPDPTGLLSTLTKRDYFFDPSTFLLIRTQDFMHPDWDAVNGAIARTIDFGNYQAINGLLVPFSISESVAGNQVWQIQLTSISFNTGLSDSDFQF